MRSVHARVSANYGLYQFSFTKNSKYLDIQRRFRNEESLYIERNQLCNLGRARYHDEQANSTNKFHVSTGFANAIRALPIVSLSQKLTDYYNFLNTWGTHVVTETVLGSKYSEQYKVGHEEAFKFALNHNNVGISVSGSSPSASASLSLNIDTLMRRTSFMSSLDSTKRVITIGSSHRWNPGQNRWVKQEAPGYNEPIDITIVPITNFLSPDYTSDQKVLERKTTLEHAMISYPNYRAARLPQDDSLLNMRVAWPKGTYGLVRPVGGCPKDSNSEWKFGLRSHDTEDDNPNNKWSSTYDLAGWIQKNNMQWQFCIKVSNGQSDIDYPWPRGSYCILKKGDCPDRFQEGFIFWDDEDDDNINIHGGTLPDGEYTDSTKIEFCCRRDGSTANQIILPTNKPFILLQATSLCQRVYGMQVSHQWIRWDNEDVDNIDQKSEHAPYEDGGDINHILHFCYYYK